MPEILNLIERNGLALVALVIVSGALTYVARLLVNELTSRAKRAEDKVDQYHALVSTMAHNIETLRDFLVRGKG